MAREGIVTVLAATPTQLTNADIAGNITFQHRGGGDALLLGAVDGTAPSAADFDNGILYRAGEFKGWVGSLSDLFPGAGYVRLWAYSIGGCQFSVFHG